MELFTVYKGVNIMSENWLNKYAKYKQSFKKQGTSKSLTLIEYLAANLTNADLPDYDDIVNQIDESELDIKELYNMSSVTRVYIYLWLVRDRMRLKTARSSVRSPDSKNVHYSKVVNHFLSKLDCIDNEMPSIGHINIILGLSMLYYRNINNELAAALVEQGINMLLVNSLSQEDKEAELIAMARANLTNEQLKELGEKHGVKLVLAEPKS